MVYGLCRLLLQDSVEAEDAAQQSFLSAHKALLAGQEPREPAAWLAAIARNECRTRIRERMATPLSLVDDAAVGGGDPSDIADQNAEVHDLCRALAELPQQQRQAIVLREFYGLSYEEAATALGVSRSALESLLFRCRRRLQDELRPARLARGAIAVPFALRDSLANALPGFSPSAGSGVAAGGAAAKLASVPLVAKLVAAGVLAVAAGSVAVKELPRAETAVAQARTAQSHAASRSYESRTREKEADLAPVARLSVLAGAKITLARAQESDDQAEDTAEEREGPGEEHEESEGSGSGSGNEDGDESGSDEGGGSGPADAEPDTDDTEAGGSGDSGDSGETSGDTAEEPSSSGSDEDVNPLPAADSGDEPDSGELIPDAGDVTSEPSSGDN